MKHFDSKEGQRTPIQQVEKQQSAALSMVDNRPEAALQRKMMDMVAGTAQRVEDEDEEPTQGKFATAQRVTDEDEELPAQGKFDTVQRVEENNTGMPDQLKSGIENLSGEDMSGVKVHYNSDKPAQLNALAYAQGNDIHLGSGQEQHLPHEAWHVVQQRQGRVQPTTEVAGQSVNDDVSLESEADKMGEEALKIGQ